MRQPRLKPPGQVNVFHCLSRTAGRQRLAHRQGVHHHQDLVDQLDCLAGADVADTCDDGTFIVPSAP